MFSSTQEQKYETHEAFGLSFKHKNRPATGDVPEVTSVLTEGTVAAMGIITTDTTRKKFVTSFWNRETCGFFWEAKI